MAFWCKGKKDYCNDTSCEACNKCKFEDGSGGIELEDDAPNGIIICQWISVEDRLPDTRHTMLVCTRNRNNVPKIAMAYFENGFGWCGSGRRWNNVTHWMPLPEPPKEDER